MLFIMGASDSLALIIAYNVKNFSESIRIGRVSRDLKFSRSC